MPGVLRGLVLVTIAVWVVLELRQSGNARPEARRVDRASKVVLFAMVTVGFAVAANAPGSVPAAAIARPAVAAWIGLVLMWCGIALRFWSFHTLGRYFTFSVETSVDQPVITAGPYRVIRHPSYAGLLIAFIGAGLQYRNWVSLLVLLVASVGGLVYRIGVEERALTRALGDRYRAYAATHKRLIPFIW
jgi:protein-S-isoprenylcysteine O-methyltransferase Ste14